MQLFGASLCRGGAAERFLARFRPRARIAAPAGRGARSPPRSLAGLPLLRRRPAHSLRPPGRGGGYVVRPSSPQAGLFFKAPAPPLLAPSPPPPKTGGGWGLRRNVSPVGHRPQALRQHTRAMPGGSPRSPRKTTRAASRQIKKPRRGRGPPQAQAGWGPAPGRFSGKTKSSRAAAAARQTATYSGHQQSTTTYRHRTPCRHGVRKTLDTVHQKGRHSAKDVTPQPTPPPYLAATLNRDIRFAKDKTLYKTQMYLKFQQPLPGDRESGQLYVGLSTDTVTAGFRVYAGPKRRESSLALVAEPRVLAHPNWVAEQKRRLAKKYDSYWYTTEKGEWTKHDGWPADLEQWRKIQGWIVRKMMPPSAATTQEFPKALSKIFREVYPLLKFTSIP